jgi:hypothetical protein
LTTARRFIFITTEQLFSPQPQPLSQIEHVLPFASDLARADAALSPPRFEVIDSIVALIPAVG